MLYPTYLSSYTHLVQSDITPISISTIFGKNVTRFFSTKPVVAPPPPESTAEALPNTRAVPRKNVSPITIPDQRSTEVLSNRGKSTTRIQNETPIRSKAVNPLIGGFGRFIGMLLVERSIQLFSFPYV